MIKISRALVVILALLITGQSLVWAESNGAFVSTSLTLYQPDAALRTRIGNDVAPLGSYVLALTTIADRAFSSVPHAPGVTGSIVVAVKPGGLSRFWLVLGNNELPKGLQEALLKELASVKPLAVNNGPVAFAINFDAWGGGQTNLAPNEPFPYPRDRIVFRYPSTLRLAGLPIGFFSNSILRVAIVFDSPDDTNQFSIFSFEGIGVVLPILEITAKPQQYPKVIIAVLITVLVSYVAFG